MQILVIENHKLYRQALGLCKPAIAKNAEIFALATFEDLWRLDLDLGHFSLAIVDPDIHPDAGVSLEQSRALRVQHVLKLRRDLNSAARLIVLTGCPSAKEQAEFARAGIPDYLSKTHIGLLGLRDLIVNDQSACTPSEMLIEHYFTEHTTREALGFAVRQKIISKHQAARALGVEIEAIDQYAARGMRRFRAAKKTSGF